MIAKKNSTPTVAVIGDGSWPTALIKILAESKVDIRWWVRLEQDVTYIKQNWSNPNYLTGVVIDKKFGSPTITKDGVTVAKEIELKDSLENMGAQMVREVAS